MPLGLLRGGDEKLNEFKEKRTVFVEVDALKPRHSARQGDFDSGHGNGAVAREFTTRVHQVADSMS
jgi:hypothetical protein